MAEVDNRVRRRALHCSGRRFDRRPPQMQFGVGQIVDERYVVRSFWGRSGMWESYRAVDRTTNQLVLLKVPQVKTAGDLTALNGFRHEVQIGTLLDHSGIQRLLSGPPSKPMRWPYLVMEYVEGETLRSYLHDGGILTVDEVMRIGAELASVLSYIHQQGVVQGGITPDHVLLGVDGTVKLTDFTLARLRRACDLLSIQSPRPPGTVDYMAPEQLRGRSCDPRTDVYALGVVLYQLLAGRLPYPTRDALEVMYARENLDLPLIRRLRPDVPPALEAIVYRALRQRPEQRYQSMAELHHDLTHLETVVIPVYVRGSLPPGKPSDWPASRIIPLILFAFALLGIIGVLAEVVHRALPPR